MRNLSAMKSRSTDKAVPRITAPRFPVFDKKVQYRTEDPLVRNSKTRRSSKTPDPEISFEGLDANDRGFTYPPDTVGDVGPDHYVQMVNAAFAVFDKSGNILTEETPINALWEGEDCMCAETNNGDPIVLYDSLADRWLLSQMSVSGEGYHMCIAISQTPDPTGAYYLYDFEVPAVPDYPKFGVWPDAYYMSSNERPDVGAFAFDRNRMLSGQSATFQRFLVERNFMLPSDSDGSLPPPAGSPNYFYTMMDDTYWPDKGFPGKDRIEIWEFHADFSNPDNSSFTHTYDLETAAFNYNMCRGIRHCIPQKDTEQKLCSISEFPMRRLQYRNFGSHETLVGNFTVDIGDFTDHAGIRWFELRKNKSSPWAIWQEGTLSPDRHHRWMGSIAMDGAGNIGLGYSVSSEDMYPSVRYSARFADDPPGTLRNEAVLIDGGGSQTGGNRWGDYSSMNADPVEPCTFWYTSEYYETSSDAHWQTRIGSFKIPECTEPRNGILRGVVTSADKPVEKARVNAGAFTIFTDSEGNYLFPGISPGNYEITVSCYGYKTTSAASVSIAEDETATRSFSLTSLPYTTVSGTVTDGSGAGWPLYAGIEITLPDFDTTVFTNPGTGFYSVELVQDMEYSFTVNPETGGYESETRAVTLGSDTSVEDFVLIADCTVPGYGDPIFFEYFNSYEVPDGWEVISSEYGDWRFDNPEKWGNKTGGAGGFAITHGDGNSELRTPVIDCSDLQSVLLTFKYDFKTYVHIGDVDISYDFGKNWINVWQRKFSIDSGNAKIDISNHAAGKPGVIIRFYYHAESIDYQLVSWFDYWWQVDDVKVLSCAKTVSGGLATGHVYDAAAGDFINGAAVENEQGHMTFTVPTPEDPDIDDGFYTIYLPPGFHDLSATREPYDKITHTVEVQNFEAVRQDFEVNAESFPDYALWFDGQDYYADMGKNESLNLTGALTIEAWIYPSGRKGNLPPNEITIVDKTYYSLFISTFDSVWKLNNNCLAFCIHNVGKKRRIIIYTPENSVSSDTWQHVSVTYDGIENVKIYINGIEQEVSYEYGSTPSGDIRSSTEKPLMIGRSRLMNSVFRGKIDEIRIWNIVRTPEEIKAVLNKSLEGDEPGLAGYWPMTEITGSVLKDESGNGNNGIINDAAWVGGAPVELFIDEINRIPKEFKITDYSASSIEMSWKPPSYIEGLQGYNVRRNNVKINPEPVTQAAYSDENVGYETYCYRITAVYSDGK
ncbi:MAG: hypothetical protein GY795_07250, partial [Desulfobacterales bacterium]|nr:hypothetical protein [Desulfobacterales bacterium]